MQYSRVPKLETSIMKKPSKVGGGGANHERRERGYRSTAAGTFERLLAGVKIVNEFGGGQGRQLALKEALRFDINTLARVA